MCVHAHAHALWTCKPPEAPIRAQVAAALRERANGSTCEVVELPGVGHLVQEEAAAEFVAAVQRFLQAPSRRR